MKISTLMPDELPCPGCKRKTLTYGMQFKPGETVAIEFLSAPAYAMTLRKMPAIWCTASGCHFVQWGERRGEHAVFGDGAQ